MSTATHFLVDVLFNLYLMVVLLRLWLQLVRADFYNPFSQFVVKATHPVVAPLRRVLPSMGSLDTATLVLAFIVATLKFLVIATFFMNVPYNPLDVVIFGIMIVLSEGLDLLFYVLIIRAILSWVSQGYNPIEMVLHQLTEPVMAPVRRIIPPMGGLDLSILFVLIGLQFITILLKQYIPIFGVF